jgi:hypothetical protein
VAHLEMNLAPAAGDMPDMALALIRAIIAAADQDKDETTVLLIYGQTRCGDRALRARKAPGGRRRDQLRSDPNPRVERRALSTGM